MADDLGQQATALETAMMALIQGAGDAGHDGDVLYQALINAQQSFMWLRKALGAEPAVPVQAAQEPPFDDSPPHAEATHTGPREHGGVTYWWRWRDRRWVTFDELPESAQVTAMESGRTVA